MPSYIRLLTEQQNNITTPPTGHTALFASSGTNSENKYELYIKNPEGFVHQVGGFASGGTFSANTTFNSGFTVYSGGYTSLGSPQTSIRVQGLISGLTDNTVYIQPGLNIQGTNGWTGGDTSGTTKLIYGSANTASAIFTQSFGTGNTSSSTGATSFGTGNTSSGPVSFSLGGQNIASGQYSFAAGSGNTASGTTYFTVGSKNIYSGLFTIGNGSAGNAGNLFTAQQSGITIQSSATTDAYYTHTTASTNTSTALAVLSGTGDHPLGFRLPLVESPYKHKSGSGTVPAMPAVSASTKIDGKGTMIWDGSNIRVWTGGTLWATIATHGGGGSL